MQSKERANLRGEAHHLQPLVHIGHQGVTESVVRSVDDLLRTRELVKVDVSRNVEAPVREIARALAEATSAEVVQVIGRKVTIYRDNPALEWKDNIPPWR
jgi:RNA-binding protein